MLLRRLGLTSIRGSGYKCLVMYRLPLKRQDDVCQALPWLAGRLRLEGLASSSSKMGRERLPAADRELRR